AVYPHPPRRPAHRARLALGGDRAARRRLTVVFVQRRLRIEAVRLGQAAVHEEEDHALGTRRVIELAHLEAAVLRLDCAGTHERLAHETGERQHPETVAHLAERVATGYWRLLFM